MCVGFRDADTFEQKDTMTVPILKLKAGHVLPVWAGHPWVYAQALESSKSTPAAGAEVVFGVSRNSHWPNHTVCYAGRSRE